MRFSILLLQVLVVFLLVDQCYSRKKTSRRKRGKNGNECVQAKGKCMKNCPARLVEDPDLNCPARKKKCCVRRGNGRAETVAVVVPDDPCADSGGTCIKKKNCGKGYTIDKSIKCPTRNKKCCKPEAVLEQLKVKKGRPCADSGGKCLRKCGKGRKENSSIKCPKQKICCQPTAVVGDACADAGGTCMKKKKCGKGYTIDQSIKCPTRNKKCCKPGKGSDSSQSATKSKSPDSSNSGSSKSPDSSSSGSSKSPDSSSSGSSKSPSSSSDSETDCDSDTSDSSGKGKGSSSDGSGGSSSSSSSSSSSKCQQVTTPGPGVCDGTADVVFVIDASGSIDSTEWTQLLDSVVSIIDGLSIDTGGIRVGLVQFGSSAKVEFLLDDYIWKSNITDAVLNTNKLGGGTNTGDGILKARTQVFSVLPGDRPEAKDIMIVMTDGFSGSNTIPEADDAKADCIFMMAIGVGANPNEAELKGISSTGIQGNGTGIPGATWWVAPTFNVTQAIVNSIIDGLCDAPANCTTGMTTATP